MPLVQSAPPKQLHPFRRFLAIALLVILLPVILLIIFEVIGFKKVPSSSMEPTLYSGDYIFTLRTSQYQHGDIVVFHDPDSKKEFLVKRIIAMEGDTISVKGGAVFLNGRYASEPYRHSPINYKMKPYTVPEGELFLMGDHSNWSIDSHNWGQVNTPDGEIIQEGKPRSIPIDLVVGKVRHIYLPKERRGSVSSYPLRAIGPEG